MIPHFLSCVWKISCAYSWPLDTSAAVLLNQWEIAILSGSRLSRLHNRFLPQYGQKMGLYCYSHTDPTATRPEEKVPEWYLWDTSLKGVRSFFGSSRQPFLRDRHRRRILGAHYGLNSLRGLLYPLNGQRI